MSSYRNLFGPTSPSCQRPRSEARERRSGLSEAVAWSFVQSPRQSRVWRVQNCHSCSCQRCLPGPPEWQAGGGGGCSEILVGSYDTLKSQRVTHTNLPHGFCCKWVRGGSLLRECLAARLFARKHDSERCSFPKCKEAMHRGAVYTCVSGCARAWDLGLQS